MNAPSIIVIVILAVIVFFAVRYIIKEKKKGRKCIGCPIEGDCCKNKKNDRCS